MSKFKTTIILLLTVFIFSYSLLPFSLPLSSTSSVHAQPPDDPPEDEEDAGLWYSPTWQQFYLKTFDTDPTDLFGERYTYAQVNWIIFSLLTFPFVHLLPSGDLVMLCFFRIGVTGCLSEIYQELGGDGASVVQDSSLAEVPRETLLQSVFRERSFSGITYFKNIARKFEIVPAAQAQEGFGFTSALGPVQTMWKASRDITYVLFAVVALALSFMIMFRVKLAPQVAITIQSAIPRLAFTIILVTFSYAIAGLLIDLMYVVIGFISVLAERFFPISFTPQGWFDLLTRGNPAASVPGVGENNLGFLYLAGLYLIIFMLTLMFVAAVALGMFSNFIDSIFGPGGMLDFATGGFVWLILILVAALILIIACLIAIFKVMWILVKTYAMILLLTIFAPFQILLGALIPSNISPMIGFKAWLKSYISHLSVFVVTGFLFVISLAFLAQAFILAAQEAVADVADALIENLLGAVFGTEVNLLDIIPIGTPTGVWPPLLGIGGNAGAAMLMVVTSFVIFVIIPKTADMIKAIIQRQPFSYGTAVGEALGPLRLGGGLGIAGGAGYVGGRLQLPAGSGGWLGGKFSGGWKKELVRELTTAIQKRTLR